MNCYYLHFHDKIYAEKAIEYKVKANNNRYKMYFEMANDELKHAKFLHDIVTEEIDRLRHTVTPPPDMVKEIGRAHV